MLYLDTGCTLTVQKLTTILVRIFVEIPQNTINHFKRRNPWYNKHMVQRSCTILWCCHDTWKKIWIACCMILLISLFFVALNYGKPFASWYRKFPLIKLFAISLLIALNPIQISRDINYEIFFWLRSGVEFKLHRFSTARVWKLIRQKWIKLFWPCI